MRIMQRPTSSRDGKAGNAGAGSCAHDGPAARSRAPQKSGKGGDWEPALQAFFEQMHGAPEVVVAMGRHRHWTGKMVFFGDGKYFVVKKGGRGKKADVGFSKDSDKAGMWQLNNGKLQLVWFKWNTELLQQNPDNTTFQCKSYKFAIDFGELCEDWFGLNEAAVNQLIASSAGAMNRRKGKAKNGRRNDRGDRKGRRKDRGKKEILPQNYERTKGFVKLRMPTRAERTQILKEKMLDIGENIESGHLTDNTVDPTEVTAFCLGALFDFHQLTTLEMKHEGGQTLCGDLLSFSDKLKRKIESYRLGNFLERNDEKRISVLEPKVQEIWKGIREAVRAVPDMDSDSEDEDGGAPGTPSPRSSTQPQPGKPLTPSGGRRPSSQGAAEAPVSNTPVKERPVMSTEQLHNAVDAMIR